MLESGTVDLVVLDLRGRPVRTVLRGEYPEGNHRVSVDVTGLRSGRYIFRMKVSGSAQEAILDVVR